MPYGRGHAVAGDRLSSQQDPIRVNYIARVDLRAYESETSPDGQSSKPDDRSGDRACEGRRFRVFVSRNGSEIRKHHRPRARSPEACARRTIAVHATTRRFDPRSYCFHTPVDLYARAYPSFY